MGLLDSVFKNIPVVGQVINMVDAIKSGDFKALLSSVSSLALTFATGGAGAMMGPLTSMVSNFGAKMVGQALTNHFMSQIGQQVIQNLGDKMGLPQSAIDAAQGAFCEACGDKAGARQNFKEAGHLGEGNFIDRLTVSRSERKESQQFLAAILGGSANPGPVRVGQADQAASQLMDKIESSFQDFANDLLGQDADKERQVRNGGSAAAAKGGSILMRIAMAMGGAIDDKMEEMDKGATALGNLADGKKDETGDKQIKYGQESAKLSALGQEMKILQEALNNVLKSIGDASSGLARKQ